MGRQGGYGCGMRPDQQPADARVILHQARDEAAAAVAATADPHEAFNLATNLAAEFMTVARQVAQLRGAAARRIKEQDKLSLRGLADQIGMSHQRAEQLLKTASEAPK